MSSFFFGWLVHFTIDSKRLKYSLVSNQAWPSSPIVSAESSNACYLKFLNSILNSYPLPIQWVFQVIGFCMSHDITTKHPHKFEWNPSQEFGKWTSSELWPAIKWWFLRWKMMVLWFYYLKNDGFLVGGWPTPLKNDGVKVSWGYEIPKIWKNKKCSKPPTSFSFMSTLAKNMLFFISNRHSFTGVMFKN